MKLKLAFFTILFSICNYSYAQGLDPVQHPGPLKCTVNGVVPVGSNFFHVRNIGPIPGDTIVIDTTNSVIDQLIFDTRSDGKVPSIPVHRSNSVLRQNPSAYPSVQKYVGHSEGIAAPDYFGLVTIYHNLEVKTSDVEIKIVALDFGDTVALNVARLSCIQLNP